MNCLWVILLLCASVHAEVIEEKPFVVVIPSYNNVKYYEKNLASVFSQQYENYRVIYIDDASTDGTGELVQAYLEEHGMQGRVTFVQNTENKRALHNLYHAIMSCDDREIIVSLDGDDWFAHDGVLKRLNKVYQDLDVWITYGQFLNYPSGKIGLCRPFPKRIVAENRFREYRWISSQLRTFYAKLFKCIKVADLQQDKTFFPVACDVAMMFPMLEMAGVRYRFISEVLYIYNRENPISDDVVRRKEQAATCESIRRMNRYVPLENLFNDEENA